MSYQKKEIPPIELSNIIINIGNTLDNISIKGYDIKILRIGQPDEFTGEYDLLLTAKIALNKK